MTYLQVQRHRLDRLRETVTTDSKPAITKSYVIGSFTPTTPAQKATLRAYIESRPDYPEHGHKYLGAFGLDQEPETTA